MEILVVSHAFFKYPLSFYGLSFPKLKLNFSFNMVKFISLSFCYFLKVDN
jgi:hypothetical protein